MAQLECSTYGGCEKINIPLTMGLRKEVFVLIIIRHGQTRQITEIKNNSKIQPVEETEQQGKATNGEEDWVDSYKEVGHIGRK